jgi:hypothetical protein
MNNERQTAKLLASLGNEALLAPPVKNLVGGPADLFPADLLLNGVATEIKTPRSFGARSLERQIAARQSDQFVIRIDKPLVEPDRALNKLKNRMERYPGKRVWLLYAYDTPRLEELR